MTKYSDSMVGVNPVPEDFSVVWTDMVGFNKELHGTSKDILDIIYDQDSSFGIKSYKMTACLDKLNALKENLNKIEKKINQVGLQQQPTSTK